MCLSVSVRRAILLLPAVLSPLAVAQVQLEFAPALSGPTTYSRVVQLLDGSRLFVGSRTVSSALGLYSPPVQRQQIALASLGPAPGLYPYPYPAPGGSGNDVPQAVAVDRSGNIWIAGETDSDDFTLVNPIVSQKVPYRTAGFVIELDPTGQKLLFATYLGGQQRASPVGYVNNPVYASFATAITLDAAGNAYVGGSTNETDFPTTPGAFLTGQGGIDAFGDSFFYTFLTKISPAGKLAYSTLLRSGSSGCSGGGRCVGHTSRYAGLSDLAVDAGGAVTVAGVFGGAYSLGGGYVSRVAPDGSKLTWSTQVAGLWAVASVTMAQDSIGNVNLFGQYVTPVANPYLIEPAYSAGPAGLYAARLSANGSDWIYTTDLGLSPDARAAGITLDSSGNAYLAGTSSSPQFPALAGVPALGADFVLRLDAAGTKPQKLFRFPTGVVTAPPAFDDNGRLMLPGSHGSLLHLPPTYAFDTQEIVAFGNSASYELNTGLYPGALVSLFGFNLPVSAQGLQVLIGGLPAPVLYSGSNQINIQVPFRTSIYGSQVQVVLPSASLMLQPPFAQSLGIFTIDGVHAAALNQDGTINSASNPAPAGSIVSVFGTGAVWPSGMPDGVVATAPMTLDGYRNQFVASDNIGTPLAILYAGAAPGLIDGVFQMNLEVPLAFNGPFTVQTKDSFGATLSSNPVQVYVK